MTTRASIRIAIFILSACGGEVFGQTVLKTSNLSNGAGTVSSASYKLKGTIGQPVSGNAGSASYQLFSGFEPGSSAVVPKFPDLVFIASGVQPTTVAPGQTTSMTLTVKNTGDDAVVGAVIVRAYLSINTALDASDIPLQTFTIGANLAVNDQIVYPGAGDPNKITIPAATTLQPYQVLLVLDPDFAIAEKNETNNISALPLTVSNASGTGSALKLENFLFSGGVASVQTTGGDGTISVQFHHRKISEAAFTAVDVTSATTAFTSTVTADMSDELGAEFYFSATDDAGTVESTHGFSYQSIAAANSTIPFTSAFGGSAATYEMFSVPYKLDETIASTVFDELGGADKTKWRLLHWQGDRYLEFPDNLTNIDPGKGYWFNMKGKTEINAGSGAVLQVSQAAPFTMQLDKGWNQIGDPYPFNLDWEAVKTANPGAGLNSLWLFKGGYVAKTVLPAWRGGFVFSDNGGAVSFPLQARTNQSGRVKDAVLAPRIDEDSWQINLALEHNGLEQLSAVGMDPQAKSSKDRFDEMTVPRFIQYLEMSTYHEEFFAPYFSADIVPTADAMSWVFTTESSESTGQGLLRWDQQALAGSGASLALVDLKEGVVVDMRKETQYSFSWSDGRQFKVLFSRDGEIKPGVTLLGSAFPNPFSEKVNIPVLLESDQNRISIEVYDMMGRRVKTLSKEQAAAGVHVVEWDGHNDQGSRMDGGIYLYQLRGDKGILSAPKRIIKQ